MEAVSRPLARNRWARLAPIVFITYSLAYIDRANYGFGAAGGMAASLHITQSLSSLLGALFFLGYFVFQIPGGHYAENKSARQLIFWGLIIWGFLASATGVISNIPLLMIDRFLLGVVEGVVLPGLLVFLSHWFTKAERSRTNTFLILGNPVTVLWMSIVSGYLVHAVGWRWMFIFEGAPAIIWAFIWRLLVNDDPKDARWLTAREKSEIDTVLRSEQRDLAPVSGYLEAFKQTNIILLAAQYFFWSIGVYGFVIWLPSILKAVAQLGLVATGWLSAMPYLLAVILMIVVSHYSDHTLGRKIYIWPFLLIGAIAFYASYAIGTSSFWVSWLLLVIAGGAMYAPYGPFFAIIPEIVPRNVAGAAIALVNSMGALGSFVGSYFVGYLNGATGGPGASYIFMAGSLLLAVIFTFAVRMESGRRAAKALRNAAREA